MPYFTILHWIALLILFVIFVLVIILVFQNSEEKSPFSVILTSFFVTILISIATIYGIDVYTKVAVLENVVQKKVLLNESFSISGQIRNVGDFTIGRCTLEVQILNDSLEKNTDGPLFVPKSSFDNILALFRRDTSVGPSIETTKNFLIVENLHKGEMRNFNVFMRYPPSFVKPYTRYELSCH